MTWTSLKKFCEQNYPDLKFKSDDARRKHCLKKGLKIQKDDEGREGIAVARDGDADTKEIRVGKRMSASKLKQMDYGEDPDKGEVAAQLAKNTSGLKITMNSKDWAALGSPIQVPFIQIVQIMPRTDCVCCQNLSEVAPFFL